MSVNLILWDKDNQFSLYQTPTALTQRVLTVGTLGLAGRRSVRLDAPDTAANSLMDTLADYTFMDSLEAEALLAASEEAPAPLDGLVVAELDAPEEFERYFLRGQR